MIVEAAIQRADGDGQRRFQKQTRGGAAATHGDDRLASGEAVVGEPVEGEGGRAAADAGRGGAARGAVVRGL